MINDRLNVFKQELDLIYNKKIKKFTEACLLNAPEYVFKDCPSSTSGKHHPIDEINWDGLIIHTKRVVILAADMVKAFSCESNKDLVVAAAIIHDLRKRGVKDSFHTLSDHPAHGAALIDEVQEDTKLLSTTQHSIIRNCVGYHYGPWSVAPWLKPIDTFTKEELSVFISDFTVSKKYIKTDYRR